LAVRTLYERRHWSLPLTEWICLWAGLGIPLLLIRNVVATTLAASLYGFEPNNERVVIVLLTSGTQGLQLAPLAPGWVHGCLGLWFRLRHYPLARRMKPALLALVVLMPVPSAPGFIRMMRLVEAKKGFVLLPRRSVVERSFGWLNRLWRLERDYERLPETLAGLHFVVFAMLMLVRAVPIIQSA
jgi:adenylate cyclase